MKQIDKYISKLIREHKSCKTGWPIWKLMPISKCWIGQPKIQYVIWWGKHILYHCDSYNDAVKLRRKIWETA